jgi:anaerobic magnesium-protoporphyrin IX monomethyl ester cyclase
MGKALLINPSYFRTYGSNEGGIAFPVYPILSLAALGGSLRDRGHQFRILDLSYRRYDPRLIRETILEEKPDLIGLTATTTLANQVRDISYLAKEVSPSILTVAGGAHASALPYETLSESILDVAAQGEHDFTLADILDGRPLDEVPGIWWRDTTGAIRNNPPRRLVDHLDDLPMPAWESYPLDCNKRITKIIARYNPVTTIEFSRGCVFQCDFCGSKNTMGLGYRKKSPERCAEELTYLEKLGYRETVLVDDIFTSDNNWAAQVCEAILRRNVKVAWTCTNGIRVDSCNLELFQLMKRAGCYRVYFGFESGNDNVIKAFGKGGKATLEKGVEAVELAQRAGLEPNGFFLVGLTGDTQETMQDTIDYARRVKLDTMKCGITVPFPGTPMFNRLRQQGRIKTFDWDRYNVYQNAEALFDHPTVEWPIVRAYLKKFYRDAYFRNPGYIWRRLLFMIKNHEIFWNVYYTIKFWFLLWGKPKASSRETYAYENTWRALDTKPAAIRTYEVPRVRKASSKPAPPPSDGVARQAV